MALPTFEVFSTSVRLTLSKICVPESELTLLDTKGSKFDLKEDGGVDSLDMLDVIFYTETDLGVRLTIEPLMQGKKPMTIQNLYESIVPNSNSPA